MGKVIEKLITSFDLGMTNIIRSDDARYARTIKHFDILTDPTRLFPYRDFEADSFDAGLAASTEKLCKFLAAKTADGLATQLYALGVTAGLNNPKIFQKSTIAGSWVASSAQAGTEVRNEKVFVEYKGAFYGWRSDAAGSISGTLDGATSTIWRHVITTGVFTSDVSAGVGAASYVAQGLVHSKDDILYMPWDNHIAKNNNGAWITSAITLPDNVVITSISERGNYLAIGCRSKYPYNTNSQVYLWNRDDSLTTLSEKIDFGPENLELLEELDGILFGVCTHRNTFSEVLTITPRVVFKYWDGSSPQAKQFMEFPLSSNTIQIDSIRQKINNRILFSMSVELDGNRIDAIWSMSRTPNGMSVTIDRQINNDTAITSCVPKGFFKFGDYVHVAFTDNGVYKVNRTDDSANYTASATYESLIFGESYRKFKLMGVGVMSEPLPAAGQLVLKYKKDADTSWTTIFTHGTDDSLYHEAINIESSGDNLPEFREIQLQLISTGNAVPTGLWLRAEERPEGLIEKLQRVLTGWF